MPIQVVVAFSAVDESTRDRSAFAARIVPNWLEEGDAFRGRPRAASPSLAVIPTIVAAANNEVDFLAGVLTDVGCPELSRRGVGGHAPAIAVAVGTELGAVSGVVQG